MPGAQPAARRVEHRDALRSGDAEWLGSAAKRPRDRFWCGALADPPPRGRRAIHGSLVRQLLRDSEPREPGGELRPVVRYGAAGQPTAWRRWLPDLRNLRLEPL